VSLVTAQLATAPAPAPPTDDEACYGPLGRLGFWTASHFRTVLIAWVLIAVGFGLTLA
jgi:hypothetical protein